MQTSNPLDAALSTCSLEPIWFVRVELAARDDARVREAVADAVGLSYGSVKRVRGRRSKVFTFLPLTDG